MSADLEPDDKPEHARRALTATVTFLMTVVGCIAAFAQLYQYFVGGQSSLVLAGVFTLIGIFGIAGLLSMKDRRTALTGAAVTLSIFLAAFAVVFFVRATPSPLPQASASTTATSSHSSSETVTSTSISPTSALPPPNSENSPPPPPPQQVNKTTPPTTPLPRPGPVSASVGTFTSPVNGQEVSGWSLTPRGIVKNLSSILLCIVKDESGNHFPHSAHSADGQWNAGVGIGPKRTITRPYPFTLILATATQSADDEISRQQKEKPDYEFTGLGQNLPPGIKTLAEVGITRTS